MSVALTVLAAGASIGVGVVSAPVLGSVLSKPITGDTVPTRITDLAGYLTSSAGASSSSTSRGLAPTGVEDEDLQQSIETDTQPSTAPTVNVGSKGTQTSAPTKATADQKRLLAVASLSGALVIAAATFFLIRRVTQ